MAETTRFRIRTVHDSPPIPIRDCDWCAWVGGEEEWGGGYGPTKDTAIADLLVGLEILDAADGNEFEMEDGRVVRIVDCEVIEVEGPRNG